MEPSVSQKGIELEDIGSLSDEDLLKMVLDTKESRFYGILYDRYADKVYNKCLQFIPQKEIAQDLTHDLFIKLYFKLNTFQHKSSFSTWLYSFTYNFCLNFLNRQHKGKKALEMNWNEMEVAEIEEIEDSEILELKSENLMQAMNTLNAKDKLVLIMKYQDDFSIREIAEVMELGESAIKMRINRAKKRVLDAYKTLEL